MKLNKYILVIVVALVTAFSLTANAKGNKMVKMYFFGVSTNFTDSVAYITSIQEIDSVEIKGKVKMVCDKQEYSYQLKTYFKEKGLADRTCVTVNALTLKEINKKMQQMRLRLVKKGGYALIDIKESEFKYERVVTAE